MKQTLEEKRAKAAKRQAALKARATALNRVRRPYYATPDEHVVLIDTLTELRIPTLGENHA